MATKRDEGYVVLRDALREEQEDGDRPTHHAWPRASGRHHRAQEGLMLLILRYADELRKPEPYFDKIETKAGRRCGEARRGSDRAAVRQIPT